MTTITGIEDNRLNRLMQVSRAFTNASSIGDILRLAAFQAADLLEAEKSILLLVDDDGLLRVRASFGVAQEIVARFQESLDESLVTRLIGLLGGDNPKGFVAVPLVVQGRVTGMLAVVRAHGKATTAEDEWLLSALADQTAAPLESARLGGLVEHAALIAENARLYELERIARDEAEVARREAERANEAKSQFLANMSHELRTPLNAIAGHLQLLEMELHGPITAAQGDALERIGRAQRHLLGLVNDVLNLARIESGQLQYDIRPVLLADLLRDVSALVGSQFAAKSIQFDVRLPEDERGADALLVRADRERLLQVLINLLGNAIKFTPEGGRVSMTLRRRVGDTDSAFIEVTDSGPGIPLDRREEIFAPFVQLQVGTRSVREGAGLGLAISRDLARGMGGDLVLEESSDRGSTFTLRLRRAVAEPLSPRDAG